MENVSFESGVEERGTQWRLYGVYILGASGVAIIAAGGTDLYCHSEPPPTSGKLCFIINFIGGHRGKGIIFTAGADLPVPPPLNRPWRD